MSDAIIVALITGGLSLSGVLISNIMAAQNMDAKLEKQQATIPNPCCKRPKLYISKQIKTIRINMVEVFTMFGLKYQKTNMTLM